MTVEISGLIGHLSSLPPRLTEYHRKESEVRQAPEEEGKHYGNLSSRDAMTSALTN